MSCNNGCGCCCNFVKTTDIKLSGTTLVFVIPDEILFDGMERCICLTDNIPDYTGIPDIAIEVGGGAYTSLATQIRDCNGKVENTPNNLYVDQLKQDNNCQAPKIKNREVYKFRFATDTKCWNLCKVVKKSCGVILNESSSIARQFQPMPKEDLKGGK